jgi:hypothetical protein
MFIPYQFSFSQEFVARADGNEQQQDGEPAQDHHHQVQEEPVRAQAHQQG